MRVASLLITVAICLPGAGCKQSNKAKQSSPAQPPAVAATPKVPPAAEGDGPAPPPITVGAAGYTTAELPLPGGGADGIWMDVLAFDARTNSVWVPAGGSGFVDVVDAASGKLTRIEGFATREMERHGHKRTVGPSSATVGDGVVYVGSRGDFTVCAIDDKTLARRVCGPALDAMPDLIGYLASTKEVWVTTPRDKSIRILDGKTLVQTAKLSFDGEPESIAFDIGRGRAYTNLEDKDQTLAIDVKSHETVATWKTTCGEEGGHGLRLDAAAGWLFVGCSARAEVMDVVHDGAVLSSIDTGDGVDDLDYSDETHLLYVGSSRAARLTIATVGAGGELKLTAQVPTKPGARNAVVDAAGKAYLPVSKESQLLVASPPAG